MTLAFASIFDDTIIQNIQDFLPQETIEWDNLYGKCRIYHTDHYITYGGGPEGGFVYFYREREPGWYSWHRGWMEKPTYVKIEGVVVFRINEEGSEFIAAVPNGTEIEEGEDETIIFGDHDEMQGRDRFDFYT